MMQEYQGLVSAGLNPEEHQALRRALRRSGPAGRRASELLHRFLLAEVVNGILQSLSFDELLERLLELAANTLAADRGSIFLHDEESDELFAYVAQRGTLAQLRIPRATGIAGFVFATGESLVVHDAYADPRFNPAVDQRTGYRTQSAVCVPLRTRDGRILGVFEVLNKREGRFDEVDLTLFQAIAAQAATALGWAHAYEQERRARSRDEKLLAAAETIAVELDLNQLLERIVASAADLLDCERATLFVHDAVADELWSRIVAGGKVDEIRIASKAGIAGASFTTRKIITVPDVRADRRFDPAVDARTGYVTRNLLCVPIIDTKGHATGVLEALNKHVGRFSAADERRLRHLASQAATALQNAELFADVLSLKQHTDSILRSLSDAVIALDRNYEIVRVNEAARKALRIPDGEKITGAADRLWGAANPWLKEALAYVSTTGAADHRADMLFVLGDGAALDVNATVAPLRDRAGEMTGITLIFQDISREKRVRSTMTRYMAKEFADRVLATGAERASSSTHVATVLFSDIRRFTTIAEALTPQEVVDMLNEYFGEMTGIVESHGGAIDKYIGDAVMAVFGAPIEREAAAESAVAAAVRMVVRLRAFNERRASRGAKPLEIAIGLASGEIVAGPVGSTTRMEYTVIGDSVNLASRLEGVNRHYGTTILVDAATAARLAPPARLRPIDLIRVKGKENPTEIFEVLDHIEDNAARRLADFLPPFEDGIRRYRVRDWSGALGRFAAALNVIPDDGPSWVYTDRCLYYRDHPPPAAWDGIWTLETK
ncbi:MAG TPA: GAF domain-containing protein [Stellaceae bacterium]|nr:GAF domain-containing protein [Stellaceae bacterium]